MIMKSSLKIVLAAALITFSIASCTKKGGETTSPVDTVQTPVDTAQVAVDTTGAEGDTTAH
jgi:predicted small lipoprotein YifL